MAAIIGNRNITLGVLGGRLITACAGFGGEVFGITPYDAATTRYLKATYPGHWQAIRDYGFANPSMIPWIEEDNDLIVSLVSVGKERWLVGDGKAWINANFIATQNTTAKARAKLLGTSSYQGIFGARSGAASRAFDICFLHPNKIFFDFSNSSIDNITGITIGVPADVEMNKEGGWLNGTKVFNSSTATFTTPSKVALFGRTDGGTTNTRPLNGAISYAEFGGDIDLCFVPYKNPNGDDYGMLDLVNLQWYGNANTSGAFTIEITDTPT